MLAPRKLPRLPLIDVASRYIPAQAGVSGDFYQVAVGRNGAADRRRRRRGREGDGCRAAVDLRPRDGRGLRSLCRRPGVDRPDRNTELVHQYGVSAHFITMLCVVVHPGRHRDLGVGRSPAAGAIADGEPDRADPTGHPLGIAPEIVELEVARAPLPAAGILLYTDGLTDARPSRRGSSRSARAAFARRSASSTRRRPRSR